jgi:uncharacterized membrane-anchored protein
MRTLMAATLLAAAPAVPAAAQEQPADSGMTAQQFEAQLKWQQGPVVVADGKAVVNVPAGFRYLDPAQSARLLAAWGNPPDQKTLGMLFPADLSPFSDEGWGVVMTYDEDGHVKDDDAAGINYADLLRDMQKETEDANGERAKDGYEAVHLVGWAEQPRYDQPSHKLFWAKELQFGTHPAHTLNYNIRVLGRNGVLVLNAVASMGQIEPVRAGMQQVLGFVDFSEGNRYADFVAGKDKVAAYGVAALIAGAVASKAGLFKLLLAGLIAAKKVVVVAAVGAAAWVKKWWAGRQEKPATPA